MFTREARLVRSARELLRSLRYMVNIRLRSKRKYHRPIGVGSKIKWQNYNVMISIELSKGMNVCSA